MSKRLILFWFGLLVFLSSALLMILEIVAGRIIAPYVGVSLYTWSSVIGVVLGGLSLGNWLGGRWADRGAGEREVGLTLLFSSVASIAILFLLTFIAPLIQTAQINLLGASFLYGKRYTYVISARSNQQMPQQIMARHGFKRSWVNITRQVISTGTKLTAIPLLTDDYAPVERLSADLVLKGYGL